MTHLIDRFEPSEILHIVSIANKLKILDTHEKKYLLAVRMGTKYENGIYNLKPEEKDKFLKIFFSFMNQYPKFYACVKDDCDVCDRLKTLKKDFETDRSSEEFSLVMKWFNQGKSHYTPEEVLEEAEPVKTMTRFSSEQLEPEDQTLSAENELDSSVSEISGTEAEKKIDAEPGLVKSDVKVVKAVKTAKTVKAVKAVKTVKMVRSASGTGSHEIQTDPETVQKSVGYKKDELRVPAITVQKKGKTAPHTVSAADKYREMRRKASMSFMTFIDEEKSEKSKLNSDSDPSVDQRGDSSFSADQSPSQPLMSEDIPQQTAAPSYPEAAADIHESPSGLLTLNPKHPAASAIMKMINANLDFMGESDLRTFAYDSQNMLRSLLNSLSGQSLTETSEDQTANGSKCQAVG